jgi:hypothetical protein
VQNEGFQHRERDGHFYCGYEEGLRGRHSVILRGAVEGGVERRHIVISQTSDGNYYEA